jgi:DNA-binding beta-propeller fold protein YncE
MVLTISDGGEIFVTDWGNSRINVFDLEGNSLRTLSSKGRGAGELTNPTGIKIGPDGNLWVVDSGNNRVQVLTQDGDFVKGFGAFGAGPAEFNVPTSIAFDNADRFYISEFRGNRIQVFDLEFNYQGDLVPGVLQGPHGMVFDANGDLYVADTGNGLIRKLSLTED